MRASALGQKQTRAPLWPRSLALQQSAPAEGATPEAGWAWAFSSGQLSMEYQVVSSVGSYAATAAYSSAPTVWFAHLATFSATGNGGGGGTVANPSISPSSGTYNSPQMMTVSDSTSGATICVRTDGITPTANTAGTCDSPAQMRLWQRRFYDFNVWSFHKKNEKLNYMHFNRVRRRLVDHPKSWPWSSYRHYMIGGLVLCPPNPEWKPSAANAAKHQQRTLTLPSVRHPPRLRRRRC